MNYENGNNMQANNTLQTTDDYKMHSIKHEQSTYHNTAEVSKSSSYELMCYVDG
jgi:hypothetical protein